MEGKLPGNTRRKKQKGEALQGDRENKKHLSVEQREPTRDNQTTTIETKPHSGETMSSSSQDSLDVLATNFKKYLGQPA